MKRILITGMSGTGKSTVIEQLATLGYKAVDLDNDEFSEWVDVDPDTSSLRHRVKTGYGRRIGYSNFCQWKTRIY